MAVFVDRLIIFKVHLILILLFSLICIILSIINVVVSIKNEDDIFDNESFGESVSGSIFLKYLAYYSIVILSFGAVIGGGFIPFFSVGVLYESILGVISIVLYCIGTGVYLYNANNEKIDNPGRFYIAFTGVSALIAGFLDNFAYCTFAGSLYIIIYIIGGLLAYWATKIYEDIKFDKKYYNDNK